MKTTTFSLYKQFVNAKAYLLLAALIPFLLNTNLYAQKRIVLQHNGQASVYAVMDSLKAHIQAGDTVYFPGKGFNIGNWVIDKRVTLFGAGHHPDSTMVTGATYLDGNIVLKTGADNTFIQGIYLNGNITLGSDATNQTVNNLTISRCNIASLNLSFDGVATNAASNILIDENIIRNSFQGGNTTFVMVSNNILHQAVNYFFDTQFNNNIFLGYYCGGGPLFSVNSGSFLNNVFCLGYSNCGGNYFMNGCNVNNFQNNAFSTGQVFPDGSSTGSGNWNSINPAVFFVNQSGFAFSYTHNYHLQAPLSYIGTDATQIGLYGSATPYKEGVVPINPHIQAKTIAPATNTSGELNINIKVAAQNY